MTTEQRLELFLGIWNRYLAANPDHTAQIDREIAAKLGEIAAAFPGIPDPTPVAEINEA